MTLQYKLHFSFLIFITNISYLFNCVFLLKFKYPVIHVDDHVVAEAYLDLTQVDIKDMITFFISFFFPLANKKNGFSRKYNYIGRAILDYFINELLGTSAWLWKNMVSNLRHFHHGLFFLGRVFPVHSIGWYDINEFKYFTRLIKFNLVLI